eukprot:7755387-Pyramimonas_sp.AAC.1
MKAFRGMKARGKNAIVNRHSLVLRRFPRPGSPGPGRRAHHHQSENPGHGARRNSAEGLG